jgi:hypothetical protein
METFIVMSKAFALRGKCTRAQTFKHKPKYHDILVFGTQSLRSTLHGGGGGGFDGTEGKAEPWREIDRARLGSGGGSGVEREQDSSPLSPQTLRHHTLSPQVSFDTVLGLF